MSANGRPQEVELPKFFGAQNSMSKFQVQIVKLEDLIYTVGAWFCFDLNVTGP